MDRLWPFVALAVAIAVGVALAPILGWLVVAIVLFLVACVAVALAGRGIDRLARVFRRAVNYLDQM